MLTLKNKLTLFAKGVAMGSANVIPGVSGGTIALITGIFERLINSLKSFDIDAVKLIFTGKFKAFAAKTDFWFLFYVFAGVGTAIISLAHLFEFLFNNYPVYIWSYFFGLVLASVYFVGKTINKWNLATIISLIVGTAIAVTISVLTPANENDSFFYLILCGVVGVCSMILPGLSGSFVLILMGNYKLVMITAVSELNLTILLPVALGVVVGLLAFSHFLAWLLKKYNHQTMAVLTGFILGSIGTLWPWKNTITETFGDKTKTIGYDWFLPQINTGLIFAIALIIAGIATIWLTETFGSVKKND